MNTFSKIRIYQ